MAEVSNVTAGASDQGGGEEGNTEVQPTSEPVNPSTSPIAQATDNIIKKEDDPSSTHAGPDAKSFDTKSAEVPKLPEYPNRVVYRIPSYAEHDVSRDAEINMRSSKDQLPSVTQIRAAIATAIGAVSANAKLLADQEEREIEYLMANIIENELKKVQSKALHFEELELLLDVEHSQVERAQGQVLADWIRFSHYNYSTGPA